MLMSTQSSLAYTCACAYAYAYTCALVKNRLKNNDDGDVNENGEKAKGLD